MRKNVNSFTSLKRIRITTYSGPWQFARQFARQFALLAHMDPLHLERSKIHFFPKNEKPNQTSANAKKFSSSKIFETRNFFRARANQNFFQFFKIAKISI